MKTILRSSQQNFNHSLIYLALLLAPLAGLKAQGTGNHLTMYLNNCAQISATVLQFDVWAVSDGASGSDLRANAFQFGINFNTAILNPGDSITPSYIAASTDTMLPQQGWCFPPAISPDHIRFVQEVSALGNPGKTMVVGHSYRIGTFRMTCSTNFANLSNPNLSLQAPAARGKTVSEGLLYIDTANCSTSFYVTGTTDGLRSLNVTCSIILSSVEELSGNSFISIYPNPSNGNITISLDKNIKNGILAIYNIVGEKIYSDIFNGKQNTVTFKRSPGVYYIQIKTNESQYIHKIIIQ